MALFKKDQINPKLIPLINKAEAVGFIKIDGYGKCSARYQNGEIIFESYPANKQVLTIGIPQITSLSFIPGNFIIEPKMQIGVQNQIIELKGLNDNDEEFERFYKTILAIKEQQVNIQTNDQPTPDMQKTQMPHPDNGKEKIQQTQRQQESTPVINNPDINQNINNNQIDPVNEIRRYFELKQDGIITEEEFKLKKQQLLNIKK